MPRTQFRWIKLGQSIVESAEPGEFGVEREATIIADLAVVLVETVAFLRDFAGALGR